ncbi:MAG: hypothetical protein QG629_818 [Patescibacteria group bacterium]|nr:hypothetical protein [Patescibacteria group bacterium]
MNVRKKQTRSKKRVIIKQPLSPNTVALSDKLQVLFTKAGRLIANSSLPEIFLVSGYIISRYLFNADFSYPSEIVLDIALFTVLLTIIYRIFRIAVGVHGVLAVHLAALPVSYFLYDYTNAFKPLVKFFLIFFPDATSFEKVVMLTILLSIFFGALSTIFTRLVRRYAPNAYLPLLKILIFTVTFIFASQCFKMALQIWKIRSELAYKQPVISLKQDKSKVVSRPNIYYIVFDRYANDETLKDVYKFDNSKMLQTLQDQGFYTRDKAYSNYPFTMQSIGSTLRMQYHTDLYTQFKDSAQPFQAGFAYRTFLDNPPAMAELKKNGYTYNAVSSWWDFTRKSPSANHEPSQSYRLRVMGKTFWASDLQRDIINRSALSPLLLKGITIGGFPIIQYDLDRNFEQIFHLQMSELEKIVASSQQSKTPQVTFAHVLLPHDPYLFMPDGSRVEYDGERTDKDVDEYTKYKNQLEYANSNLAKLVKNIRTEDPNAVVLLQTDEGPYPKEFRGIQNAKRYYTPLLLDSAKMKYKYGSLASYYLPGVTSDEAAKNMTSHVNAFRFVLRHYLGYDLPNLPDCHFAVGAKFNLYDYKDVTKQVSPSSTSDCTSSL